MTRQEAVAVTAHEALVSALIDARTALTLISARYGRGIKINGIPLSVAIDNADRALAMAGIGFDHNGMAVRHAA
jgi:hypothetical protein